MRELFAVQRHDPGGRWVALVLVLALGVIGAWVSLLPAALAGLLATWATDACRVAGLAAEPESLSLLWRVYPLIVTGVAVAAVFARAGGVALAAVSAVVLGLGLLAIQAPVPLCPATVLGSASLLYDQAFDAYIPVSAWLVVGGVLAALPGPAPAIAGGA